MSPARRSSGLSVEVLPPEDRKRQIEDRHLVLAMDEKRAARVIHVLACAEVDIAQRFDELREASGMHVEPGAAQDAAEDQQVVEETRHKRHPDTRVTLAWR